MNSPHGAGEILMLRLTYVLGTKPKPNWPVRTVRHKPRSPKIDDCGEWGAGSQQTADDYVAHVLANAKFNTRVTQAVRNLKEAEK